MELNKILDSNTYRDRAEKLLIELPHEEIVGWKRHPVTQALLLSLYGDYMQYHQQWEGEGFVGPTADITSQANAKALGAIEAIRLITQYIEEIADVESEGL